MLLHPKNGELLHVDCFFFYFHAVKNEHYVLTQQYTDCEGFSPAFIIGIMIMIIIVIA